MPNYNQTHQFYAGVDLHARSMFVHVLSAKGKTVFERDLPAEPDAFLEHLIDAYDAQILDLERHLLKSAKVDDPVTFGFLRTIPGIGPILGLILLYEIDRIGRFPEAGNFLSYSRLVRCAHESRQDQGLRRQEDRQRPPEVGLLRSRLPDAALLRPGEVLDAAPGTETRQTQGAIGARSEDRPYGLSPVEQAAGVRCQEVSAFIKEITYKSNHLQERP